MKPDKEYKGRSHIRMFNVDCMDFMEDCDKYDLAIVDPPYGIGMDKNAGKSIKYKDGSYDEFSPDKYLFKTLIESSQNQILWGANHYISKIGLDSSCWLVWDKRENIIPRRTYADCELAWTSFDSPVRKFSHYWDGFLKKMPEHRIHQNQKPVHLYKYLLTNYAKKGDTILDTHGGSMSIAIACWDLGFDLDICELDTDYFNDAVKRFENHIAQAQLF